MTNKTFTDHELRCALLQAERRLSELASGVWVVSVHRSDAQVTQHFFRGVEGTALRYNALCTEILPEHTPTTEEELIRRLHAVFKHGHTEIRARWHRTED